MLLKVIMVRLKDRVEIEKTFPKSFLGAGHEMNDFAFGECGSAKNERGGLYITHVFDGGKAEPTVIVGEVIGYIVFIQCVQGKANVFLLVRLLDTLHFGETTE
jgi:hypothetical protein